MPPTVESCPRHGAVSKSVSVGAYYPKPKAGRGGKTGTVGVQVGGLRGSGAPGSKATLEPVYGLDKVCVDSRGFIPHGYNRHEKERSQGNIPRIPNVTKSY